MCFLSQVQQESDHNGRRQLQLQSTGNYIIAKDRHMTDLCLAPVDSDVTCLLYSTMPRFGGGKVFFQPLPELRCVWGEGHL